MNRKILITGSSKGIGKFLAQMFIQDGYDVTIHGRDPKKLKRAAKDLCPEQTVCCDLASYEQSNQVITDLRSKYFLVICCTGKSNFSKFGEGPEWLEAFNDNFLSIINTIDILKKNQKLENHAKIICLSSICGHEYHEAPLPYSCSKAALNMYIKGASRELAPLSYSINGIVLGNTFFEGSTWEKKLSESRESTLKYIENNVPSNSFATVEDIYGMINYISKTSTFLNGSLITLDGGQTTKI